MQIRSAVPADAEGIHAVSVASCRAAYEDILEDTTFLEVIDDQSRIGDLRDRLLEIEPDEPTVYLVAETSGGIRGFIQLRYGTCRPDHVDAGTAYLRSLYVHPDSWGAGIGTELLHDGLAQLPEELSRVQLGVLEGNQIGKRFYEKHGFARVDTGTFTIGGVTHETDVYAKELQYHSGGDS